MMLDNINEYQMPHALDRVGQSEAFEAVVKWYNGTKQYLILSAPTGVGKTGIISSMIPYAYVLALVRTKILQESVYKDSYNFDIIKGKSNYQCRYAPDKYRADVCAIPDSIEEKDRYRICQGSGSCEYYSEYDKFCNSPKASTSYAKFLSGNGIHNNPSLYVLDEAHEVPEIVIEKSGIDLNIKKHPFLKGFGPINKNDDMGVDLGVGVMRRIYSVALDNTPKRPSKKLPSDHEIISYKRSLIRHRQFLKQLEECANLMISSDEKELNIWHCSSTDKGGFSSRPMTASYDFKRVFNIGPTKTILMSATIGPFIGEMLGLKDDEFEYYEAPQQYPVAMRKIYDLEQPGMGRKSTIANPSLWNIQAIKISNILKLRPDVSSVILTTSKSKASDLADRLSGLGHKVFIPPKNVGTDLQLKAWEKNRKPGKVCISYNFWEGVSLDDDHMLFIAGIKYPDLSSAFERSRLNRSRKEFNYRAALNLVQGAGRIQRGHISDYLPIGNKQVFLVDGNWSRIKKFTTGDFVDRVVPWQW